MRASDLWPDNIFTILLRPLQGPNVLSRGNARLISIYNAYSILIQEPFKHDNREASYLNPLLAKNTIKILIVEDDELLNESLKLLLEDILLQNIEIRSLYTGELVVEEIEKNNYDLVFLDNKLPNKSGIEILKELKENITKQI